MTNMDIWRAMGAKTLIEYLSKETGEHHDAAVYDTGYEFDIHSLDAVRFVASVAMTKASRSGEIFVSEMPSDGSVVPIRTRPQNEEMLKAFMEREDRERITSSVYVPDSSEYCKCVQNALQYRQLHLSDMTEAERESFQRELEGAERSNLKYMALHYYLPVAFALLTLVYVIFKFTQ